MRNKPAHRGAWDGAKLQAVPPAASPSARITSPAVVNDVDAAGTVLRGEVEARVSTSEEADGYSRSVEGLAIQALRVGLGHGPSLVQTISTPDLISNSVLVRFPMLATGAIGEDTILAATVVAVPPRARWCGIDLVPGMVIVYGPGAEHTAVNPEGLSFSFCGVTLDQVEHRGSHLATPINAVPRGQVHALPPTAHTHTLRRSLLDVPVLARNGVSSGSIDDMVLTSLVGALADDDRLERVGSGSRIDSRVVVRRAIEYAETIGRIPRVREVSRAAHVSERRLRTAFDDVFAVAPSRFFRAWALSRAREMLVEADPARGDTVTRIAMSVGFNHLGKFAAAYRSAFDAHPSATLRTAA